MKFNDYLMEKCLEETHCLDDESPDVFEDWVVELDVDDLIKYAEEWHEKEILELSRNIYNTYNTPLGELKHKVEDKK